MRWPLHAGLLAIGIAIGAAVTWADLAHLAPLKIPAGVLAALFWYLFVFYAVITTVLVAKAKNTSRTFAAHFIGAITAPAAAWLLAGVLFGLYKGWEHVHKPHHADAPVAPRVMRADDERPG